MIKIDFFGRLERNTTWSMWLLVFVPAMILYVYFTQYTDPEFLGISGGVTILDSTQGYGVDQAEVFLSSLSEEGKRFYLFYFMPLDLIFPFLYAAFFAISLSALLSKILSPKSHFRFILAFPFIMAAADYLENFGIVLMISLLPDFYTGAALVTSIFSKAKWYLGAIVSLALLVSLILYLFITALTKIRGIKSAT